MFTRGTRFWHTAMWKDWHFCKGFLRCLRHFSGNMWNKYWKWRLFDGFLRFLEGFPGKMAKDHHFFLTDFWWIHLVDGKKIPLDQDNIFFTVPLWLVMTWLPSLLVKSKILGQSCQICVANFPHIWLSNSFVRLLHPAIPSGTRWEISWRRTNIWPRELGDLRGWQLSGWSLVKKWRYPLVN